MAKSTRQHVFEGMELLPEGLIPFVEKRLETSLTGHWQVEVVQRVQGLKPNSQGTAIAWDQQGLLKAMMGFWKDAFATVLGHPERSYVSELLDVRNKLAHNENFTYDDAERALDTMRRLLEAVSAGEVAEKISASRDTILRTKYAELQRNEERRKTQRSEISVETVAGLMPWREVVEPHQDVATGEFQQAEFAADLAKVHNGSAPSEYRNPREFFARTYLTEGLSNLLIGAAKRLSGAGGDPVVELQTNFGGGKTHSMLALYHMVSGTPVSDLSGLDQLLSRNGLTVPAKINRAVLVGTSRGPQDIISLEGGRKIRTTWGELAWQLGGAEVFDMIAENDARGIAPGSNVLEAIFKKCAPCLILIDEWVAYLRQIYKVEGLPSGSFDANLSFVQALTEAVKASPGTLLVASLPASQIEVGGEGGHEALARLKQTFSRVESSWRPASQEESYEIVRRRLFKEIPGDKFHHRDNTLKQFAKLYRENANDFPQGCADEDYRRKLEKAYPIHPELFDQLYTSWGSLEKFQRTRGVLRLMAQVIHELWMGNDPSVMIMPGSVVDDPSGYADKLLDDAKIHKQAEADLAVRLKVWRERKADAQGNLPDIPEPTLQDCAADIERKRLFEIIKELVLWENSTNEEVLERARAEIRRSCGGVMPPVYDPFSGGGSIPLEAQRLGLPAYGSDLNPVAVMIGKAMIEIPPKFKDIPPIHPGIKERSFYRNAEGLAEDVKHYGEWMREKAWERIGHLYPQVDLPKEYGSGKATVIAWIWARTVASPDPAFGGAHVPLASSFLLSAYAGREAMVVPKVDKANKLISYEIKQGPFSKEELEAGRNGTKASKGQDFICMFSGTPVPRDYIRREGKAGRLGQQLMAVVAEGRGGRAYCPPATIHEETLASLLGKPELLDARETFLSGETPTRAEITGGVCSAYGLTTWGSLFNDRQLNSLLTFSELFSDLREQVFKDASASGLSGDQEGLQSGGEGARAYSEALAHCVHAA